MLTSSRHTHTLWAFHTLLVHLPGLPDCRHSLRTPTACICQHLGLLLLPPPSMGCHSVFPSHHHYMVPTATPTSFTTFLYATQFRALTTILAPIYTAFATLHAYSLPPSHALSMLSHTVYTPLPYLFCTSLPHTLACLTPSLFTPPFADMGFHPPPPPQTGWVTFLTCLCGRARITNTFASTGSAHCLFSSSCLLPAYSCRYPRMGSCHSVVGRKGREDTLPTAHHHATAYLLPPPSPPFASGAGNMWLLPALYLLQTSYTQLLGCWAFAWLLYTFKRAW